MANFRKEPGPLCLHEIGGCLKDLSNNFKHALNWKMGGDMEKSMDKYKVLLVDDEEEVIQVIMKKINWEGIGFLVAGYANNGIRALEMVEEVQPDVIMTDIKMPFMDGMEMAHRIRTEYPAIKILFFTGFDEFEYAKRGNPSGSRGIYIKACELC